MGLNWSMLEYLGKLQKSGQLHDWPKQIWWGFVLLHLEGETPTLVYAYIHTSTEVMKE